MKNPHPVLPLIVLLGCLSSTGIIAEDKPPVKMATIRMRVSDMLDSPLTEDDLVTVGLIVDVVIARNGGIPFIVCRGEPERTSGAEFLVPAHLLTWTMGTGFSFTDPAAGHRLSAAPAPALSSETRSTIGLPPEAVESARAYWGELRKDGGERFLKASDMIGTTVTVGDGSSGTIEDLMTDPEAWTVVYAAIASSSVLGAEPSYRAVSYSLLDVSDMEKTETVRVPNDVMKKAPVFDAMNWPAEMPPVKNGYGTAGR